MKRPPTPKAAMPATGGASEMVPLCEPYLAGREWEYVKECLDTNWVSSVGAFVDRLEEMVAGYVGAGYGVATVNGTAALHTALLVAGVEPEDEVLLSTFSFIAPANAVRYAGAWPVYIDAEPQHWQLDPEKAADFLEQECRWRDGALRNRTTGRRVRAVLPVHVLGHPVNLDPVLAAARRYELAVIEDAAESLRAEYLTSEQAGEPVWSQVGALGDISCFSFNGNKIITTGGGGMAVTDNQEWSRRARYLTTQARDDPVEYVHHDIGYNYRLTNIQAAMGCAQMENLDGYVAAKRRIARRYEEALTQVPGISLMPCAPWARSACWLFTVLVDENKYGMSSRDVLRRLATVGIQTRPLWRPLHLNGRHKESQSYRIEHAPRLYSQGLSLPCSVGLSEEQQERVIRELARR